jgi:hypothetical protein
MHNEIIILGLAEMITELSSTVFQNENEQIDRLQFSDRKVSHEFPLKFKKCKNLNYNNLYVHSSDLDYLKSFQTIEIFGDIKIIRFYEKRYHKMDNVGEFYLSEEKRIFPT